MKLLTCRSAIVLLLALSASDYLSAQQRPVSAASGPDLIRIWGYIGLAPVLLHWESAYQAIHPKVRFENHLNSPAAVMAGLYDGVADFALMGREIWPVETMAYHWVYQQQPFGIAVLTAGLNAPGQSFTPVVIVNPENPVKSISLSQLDAIYGSEHRAAPANVRTWGELGLSGKWTSQPIHAYGFGPEDSLGVFFRHDVMRLDFKPNPGSRLLSDRDGSGVPAARRIALAVAQDPLAIGYTSLPKDMATKVLALDSPAATSPSEETVANHRYALTRTVSMYFRRFPGKPLDPKVDRFVRFVLSPQAQSLVQPSQGFLPLTAAMTEKQLQKLDAPVPAASASEWKEQ